MFTEYDDEFREEITYLKSEILKSIQNKLPEEVKSYLEIYYQLNIRAIEVIKTYSSIGKYNYSVLGVLDRDLRDIIRKIIEINDQAVFSEVTHFLYVLIKEIIKAQDLIWFKNYIAYFSFIYSLDNKRIEDCIKLMTELHVYNIEKDVSEFYDTKSFESLNKAMEYSGYSRFVYLEYEQIMKRAIEIQSVYDYKTSKKYFTKLYEFNYDQAKYKIKHIKNQMQVENNPVLNEQLELYNGWEEIEKIIFTTRKVIWLGIGAWAFKLYTTNKIKDILFKEVFNDIKGKFTNVRDLLIIYIDQIENGGEIKRWEDWDINYIEDKSLYTIDTLWVTNFMAFLASELIEANEKLLLDDFIIYTNVDFMVNKLLKSCDILLGIDIEQHAVKEKVVQLKQTLENLEKGIKLHYQIGIIKEELPKENISSLITSLANSIAEWAYIRNVITRSAKVKLVEKNIEREKPALQVNIQKSILFALSESKSIGEDIGKHFALLENSYLFSKLQEGLKIAKVELTDLSRLLDIQLIPYYKPTVLFYTGGWKPYQILTNSPHFKRTDNSQKGFEGTLYGCPLYRVDSTNDNNTRLIILNLKSLGKITHFHGEHNIRNVLISITENKSNEESILNTYYSNIGNNNIREQLLGLEPKITFGIYQCTDWETTNKEAGIIMDIIVK